MNRSSLILWFFIYCFLFVHKACGADNSPEDTGEKQPLLIGVTENRSPYVYVNKKQVNDGILIRHLNTLCERTQHDCIFIFGSFYPLLEKLQIGSLQALMVIDDAILPETDEVTLTKPLCDTNPVFIQLEINSQNIMREPSDFEGKKLGVLSGSTLHLHLLDDYSELSSIHPYDLLESAAFDLAFNHIDSLFAPEAFYLDKVKMKNLLSTAFPGKKFTAVSSKQAMKFPSNMRLAIPQSNTHLLETLNNGITEERLGGRCSELSELLRQKNLTSKTNPPR